MGHESELIYCAFEGALFPADEFHTTKAGVLVHDVVEPSHTALGGNPSTGVTIPGAMSRTLTELDDFGRKD